MNNKYRAVFLIAIISLLIAGCASPANTPATPTAAPAALTVLAPTATTAPSPTPQPNTVLLVAPAGTDAQAGQALLKELIGSSGLVLETRTELQKADLTPGVKIVVALASPAGLSDLVAAAAQTQFLVVSSTDLPAAPNLTVIRERGENQAFVAGFISTLLDTDYRAGGLLPADGSLGDTLKDAFINGGRYFCGVCAPGWPLNTYYPAVAALPAASDGPTWANAAADMFDNKKVSVYFVAPEAARPEVISYLQGKTQAERTVIVLGTQAPPDALRAQWAATVHFDNISALRQAWPDVAAGKGGAVVDAPLLVDNINNSLLGAGRMRLVKDLMDQLKAGKVYPLTIPAQ